jgi:hypothetical protein
VETQYNNNKNTGMNSEGVVIYVLCVLSAVVEAIVEGSK